MGERGLTWRIQYATRQPAADTSLLHFAQSLAGTFEIFDDGTSYLLHFPRSRKMPAELFSSLDDAKSRAASLEAGMGGPRPFGRDAKYWWAWAAIGILVALAVAYGPAVWGMVTGGAG